MTDPIVKASVWGTVVFAVVAVAAAVVPDSLAVVAVVVDLLLFAAGCVAFALALLRAAARSRTDELTLPGLFWLTGAAPPEVRRLLLGSFVAEVVVAFATASARPFTGLAFAEGQIPEWQHVGLSLVLELVGLGVAWWAWRLFGLDRPDALERFRREGRLDVPT